MDKINSNRAFLSIVIVMLATLIAPSFYRILGSDTLKILGWTEPSWALFLAARSLFFIIFVLAVGVTGDLWGRRRILLLTLAGLIGCLVASIVISSGVVIIALQTPLSILGTMARAISAAIVILVATDKRQRLRNLIYYSVITGVVSLFSPAISAELLDSIPVKTLFILPLILALLGFWMVTKFVPESRASTNMNRNDGFALGAWTFGVCALVFAGILAESIGWSHPMVIGGLLIGAVILLSLHWLSRTLASQRWRFSLHNQRRLSIIIFAGIVLNITLVAVSVQTFNFLNRVQEISVVTAGIGLAPIILGVLLIGLVGNRVNKRFGVRDTLALGLIVVAIPAVGYSILSPDLPYWAIIPFLVLLGFGFILGNAPRLVLLNNSVPINLSATIQSIGSASSHLGSALAYSFILTLLQEFTTRKYGQLLGESGFSAETITEQVSLLVTSSERFPLILRDGISFLSQDVNQILETSYVYGISRAMLILAGVCLICAVVVRVGLNEMNDEDGG